MEDLVDKNAGKLGHGAVEGNATLAKIGGRVHRAAAIAESRNALNADRRPPESRQSAGYGVDAAFQRGIVGKKERRHSLVRVPPRGTLNLLQKFRRSES